MPTDKRKPGPGKPPGLIPWQAIRLPDYAADPAAHEVSIYDPQSPCYSHFVSHLNSVTRQSLSRAVADNDYAYGEHVVIKKILCASLVMLSGSAFAQLQDLGKGDVDIYFVRHGQTIFNLYDRVQGWSDTPLTAEGASVARAFGVGSADVDFKKYYSSDLGRQRETLALIIREHHSKQQPVELRDLREVYFGGFEGLPNDVMNGAAGKAMGLASDGEMTALRQQGKMPLTDLADAIGKADLKHDAENATQVKERMQKALSFIVKDALIHHDKNVLAVSSGMSIGIMISDMTNDPLKNKGMGNAAAVKIQYRDGKYKVTEIGDMQYVTRGQKMMEATAKGDAAPRH